MLTASGRYDGASQLADENNGHFSRVLQRAWVLNKEKFLENVSWINQLKMRVGYGVTGNAAVPAYATQPPLIGIVYPNGSGVINNTSLGNVDLGWEKTAQFNYGIRFRIVQQ